MVFLIESEFAFLKKANHFMILNIFLFKIDIFFMRFLIFQFQVFKIFFIFFFPSKKRHGKKVFINFFKKFFF